MSHEAKFVIAEAFRHLLKTPQDDAFAGVSDDYDYELLPVELLVDDARDDGLAAQLIANDDGTCIGAIIRCHDRRGVEAFSADATLIGTAEDRAAARTLFDDWYRNRQANGGDPNPGGEPPPPASAGAKTDGHAGHTASDPLALARGHIARGWNPIPVNRQKKKPIGYGWQKRRLTEETVADAFNRANMNVGVQLGPMSNGLTDVDLDCREAVAIAPMLLPESRNVFGRASKLRSHWLYSTTLADKIAKACLQFQDVNGIMMLELKIGGGGKGTQSVFPGSTHESGERVDWDQDGALVTVDDDELLRQVRRLAVAVLLARHWPVEGGRHDAALTVGGFLTRAGFDEGAVVLMLEAITAAAGDEQEADRVQAARDAVKEHGDGGITRGYPKLVEAFGAAVAKKAAEWLNYKTLKAADDDDDSCPALIVKWNERHAHVLAGGKSVVLQEFKTPEGYTDFKLLSSAAFHEWNVEHEAIVGVDKNGNPVTAPETRIWMRHRKRRKYQDIGFFPGRDMPNYYNLWRGFTVEPRKGDCSKFLAHIYENACQGNDDYYAWVMAWFADIFQHPAVKCGTSLALRGKMGVGKTKIGEVMDGLLGVHYKLVADPRFVTGRFNSHMISLLMLHADEGFWAGDKKAEGKLKDLVTGNKHPIEFKGKEAFWIYNYVRLLVTGDQDWQVPAGFDERRFAILDVGEAHKQDHPYFIAIDAEMAAGGREALLYHLLHEVDCSKVNLRQIPHTKALLEQKLETAKPEQGWWLDILRRGVLPGSHVGIHLDGKPQNETPSEALYDDYIEHAKKQGVPRRAIETQLGMFLQKVVGTGLHRSKKAYHTRDRYGHLSAEKRGLVYAFPHLNKCRQLFAGLINEKLVWEVEEDDWG